MPTPEVHKLVFPARFDRADAQAWGSLYGFHHGDGDALVQKGRVILWQRPLSAFEPTTMRSVRLVEDVTAVQGFPFQHARSKTEYDRRNERLQRFARRVSTDMAENVDAVRFYRQWLAETHPSMTRHECDVASRIAARLALTSRDHARAYVRKLRAYDPARN